MKKILSSGRYLTFIAVICIIIAATTLLVYGTIVTFTVVYDTINHAYFSEKGAKKLLLSFIEMVDVFLLSTVLYVIAVGLYELFIGDLDLPDWLVITDIDMLKDKLVGVIIVVLAVVFLGQVITWDGTKDLMNLGVPMSLMIASLTFFLSQKPKKKKELSDNYDKE